MQREMPGYVAPILDPNAMDLSSLPSQDQSQINFGASDDPDQLLRRDREREVAPEINFNKPYTEKQQDYIESVGVSGFDIELVEIETEADMVKLKKGFRLNFPVLMSNILKVLLFRDEEPLACLLTAYYEISVDQEMIY